MNFFDSFLIGFITFNDKIAYLIYAVTIGFHQCCSVIGGILTFPGVKTGISKVTHVEAHIAAGVQ